MPAVAPNCPLPRPKRRGGRDSKIFCGSCAPSGAAPFNEELAKASLTLAPSLGTYLTGNEMLPMEPVSAGVTWLFKYAATRLLEE